MPPEHLRQLNKIMHKIIEKESLACIFGVKRFHQYLFGHHFVLTTDHKPLLGLLDGSRNISPQATARIQRWALTLAAYEYSLKHKTSEKHANADALSRLPVKCSYSEVPIPAEVVLLMEQIDNMPVTADMIKAWTRRDPVLARVLQFVVSGWPVAMEVEEQLKPHWSKRLELTVQDGCIIWGNRVIIPPAGRDLVLGELHQAHPGSTRMKQLARAYIWWPGLDKNIEDRVKQCSVCQETQSSPPKSPLLPIRWPSRPWSRVHVDLAGPFMGHTFFVLIDGYSKWI